MNVNKINNRAPSVLTINLEKSFDPRKTRKARKYSKGYKIVSRHLKGIGIYTNHVAVIPAGIAGIHGTGM